MHPAQHDCSTALPVDGEEVLFDKPLECWPDELSAQSLFLDVAIHVHPLDPALLVVVMVQLLENLDDLLVRSWRLQLPEVAECADRPRSRFRPQGTIAPIPQFWPYWTGPLR